MSEVQGRRKTVVKKKSLNVANLVSRSNGVEIFMRNQKVIIV